MRKLIVMAVIALAAMFIQPKPSEAGVVVWGWGGCCGYYYQPCCYSYYNYYARPYYGYYGYRNYRPYYDHARRVYRRWDRRGWY